MSISTNQKLVTHLRQILPNILSDTPVTLAYLYGSAARGQLIPLSDVDIALVLGQSKSISPKEKLRLETSVEEALEEKGIHKPDVRIIDQLTLTFKGQVVIEGIRLYSRDEVARVEFETRTWKEYLDFEPTARMMRQAFFEHVREHGLLDTEPNG